MKLSNNCADVIKAAWIALVLATGSMAVSACDEGEMENLGEDVDDAVDDATDEAEDEL